MKLSPEQQAYVAQRAQWYFDVKFSPRNSPMAFGDSVVFTGQGLSDLNRTIAEVSNPSGPWGVSITCDVGSQGTVTLGNAFPVIRQCDIQDIYAIKEAFIAYYGSVDRPNVFRSRSEGVFQYSQGAVVAQVVMTEVNGAFQYGQGTVALPVIITGTAAGSNSPYEVPYAQ